MAMSELLAKVLVAGTGNGYRDVLSSCMIYIYIYILVSLRLHCVTARRCACGGLEASQLEMYVVVDYDDGAARPVSMWKCLSADGARVWKCNDLLQFLQALYDKRMVPKSAGTGDARVRGCGCHQVRVIRRLRQLPRRHHLGRRAESHRATHHLGSNAQEMEDASNLMLLRPERCDHV